MLFLRTLLIVIFCVFYSWVCAAESFKLTCDFGQGWDEFTPRVQTHIVINDKVYFEEKNNQANLIEKSGNKLTWSYTFPFKSYEDYFKKNEAKLAIQRNGESFKNCLISKPTNFSRYIYFKSSNKINIESKSNLKKNKSAGSAPDMYTSCNLDDNGWGNCKKEPLDQATLAKYSKPSTNNQVVSEYNKVLENKLQEVERKSKELENKLAALQSQKKEINQSIAEKKDIGSGFYVSKFRHIVTNQHVVNQCKKITVGDGINTQIPADLIASDKKNDLAILQTISMEMASADTKSFVQKLSIQVVPVLSGGLMRSEDVVGGEQIYIAGYPLGNMVSDQMKLGDGIVSATKGMDNDVSQFIVSSDIKRGNSGGPVYDSKGNVVGVAVSRLNVNRTDTINFAIKGSTVKQFLSAHNVPTKWSNRQENITTQDLYKIASKQTVMVVCHR